MRADNTDNNRRHFRRVRLDCTTHVEHDDTSIPTQLIDVSLRGALIAKPAGWTGGKPGQRCRLLIELEGNAITIAMECTIAHVEDDRIGFSCEHIDIDSAAHLRRVVELNLGDPELLNRELSALN